MGQNSTVTSTTYNQQFPKVLDPYATSLLGKTEALTSQPYQPYTGERTAQFTDLQKQAYEGIAGLGPSAGTMQSQDLMRQGIQGAYDQQSFTDEGVSQKYMSPYMQNVVEIQQREAQRANDMANQQRAAQAAGAGAFGGTRHAFVEAEGQRNFALQKGDIQARGLQAAYDQGAGQFNAEQKARMEGLGIGLQGAGQLGQTANQEYQQRAGSLDAQSRAGAQQQGQVQGILNQQYQDFLDQRNEPYKQLAFTSDILHGTGNLAQTGSMYTQNPSPSTANQVSGALLAGYGAFGGSNTQTRGSAAGGIVRLAEGGMPMLGNTQAGLTGPARHPSGTAFSDANPWDDMPTGPMAQPNPFSRPPVPQYQSQTSGTAQGQPVQTANPWQPQQQTGPNPWAAPQSNPNPWQPQPQQQQGTAPMGQSPWQPKVNAYGPPAPSNNPIGAPYQAAPQSTMGSYGRPNYAEGGSVGGGSGRTMGLMDLAMQRMMMA